MVQPHLTSSDRDGQVIYMGPLVSSNKKPAHILIPTQSMPLQIRSNLVPRLLLSVFLTVTSLFSASSPASSDFTKGENCGASFAGETLIERMPLKEHYFLPTDLAEFNDDLLLYIAENGHAIILYQNQAIDTRGTPYLQSMRRFSRELHSLNPGMLFVFPKLPPDFAAKYQAYINSLEDAGRNSCISAACRTFRELNVFTEDEAHFQRPTTLLRYLWSLRGLDPHDRDLRVIALGVEPRKFMDNVEISIGTRARPLILIGAGLAGFEMWRIIFDLVAHLL